MRKGSIIMCVLIFLVSCTANFVIIKKCIHSEGDAIMNGSNLEDTLKGNKQESKADLTPTIASEDGV